ncbi:MAG: energy transducer TonB [Chitinophagaceae bacterium]|nr:energy transducer TonB [Chitinophagaceae bacterium]
MERNQILKSDVLDIIFEQRNKAYGAYELRRNYHQRARRAVTGVALFFMLTAAIPLVASWAWDKPAITKLPPQKELVQVTPVHLRNEKKPEPVKPRVKPQPKPTSTVQQTTPTIVASTMVREEDRMKTQDEMKDKLAGIEDHEGPEGLITPVIAPDESGADNGTTNTTPPQDEPANELVDFSSTMPEYPGGEEALIAFLRDNMKYPSQARNSNIEGRVVVGFIVNRDGNIENIQIKRSLGYGCDEEARRVVGMMPKWSPGDNNGKKVSVVYELPIFFELEE